MRRSGASDAPADIAAYATAGPMSVPATASTRLSVISCRTIRRRLAQREPDRDLALAPEPANQHQVRKVDAHDQQHRGHSRTQSRIDRRIRDRSAGRRAARRSRPNAFAARRHQETGRESLLVDAPAKHRDLRLCRFSRRVPFAARDDLVGMVPGFAKLLSGQRGDRHPDLGFSRQSAEPRLGDADDRVRDAVETDRAAEHGGIRTEAPDPESMPSTASGADPGARVSSAENVRPSCGSDRALKVGGLHDLAGHALGRSGTGQIPAGPSKHGRGTRRRVDAPVTLGTRIGPFLAHDARPRDPARAGAPSSAGRDPQRAAA